MNLEFIKTELFMLTIAGAFQRNKVYKDNIDEKRRIEFRRNIRSLLEKMKTEYKISVSEVRHLENLDKLKNDIEKQNSDLLRDSTISFGTVQKLLNLYLKYLWSIGLISEPPHCPIDKIIFKKINDHKTSWTNMNKADYVSAIEKISNIKGSLSIARWELKEFLRR